MNLRHALGLSFCDISFSRVARRAGSVEMAIMTTAGQFLIENGLWSLVSPSHWRAPSICPAVVRWSSVSIGAMRGSEVTATSP